MGNLLGTTNTTYDFGEMFTSLFFSTGFLVFIIIVLLLFIIFREFFTWYWKINKIISLLEDIEHNTNTRKELISNVNKKSSNRLLEDLFNAPAYIIVILGIGLTLIVISIVIIFFTPIN